MRPGAPYFVDQKKGEVNELRMLMGKLTVQRDKRKMREVVKKVIAYMTIGIDVTRLFDQMVMACSTTDLVVKKMVYLYLAHYASSNPELAILGINTLCKDCGDADPMVRGLAMRSLTSMRLPAVTEYVMEPLRRCLQDNSPYVRKAAVMGILKLFHMQPQVVHESDFVNQLYNMVRDSDAAVVANCLVVLNEIMLDEGGVAINFKLITYLLNRIHDFNQWGQTVVLSLVPKYVPRSSDEAFAFMNVLDGCLRTSNSAVALATAKSFIHVVENLDDNIRRQAYMRIRSPLITLMSTNCPETSYAVLKHVAAIVRREAGIFDDMYKQFYCRQNDLTHVQYVKLEILPQIANVGNVGEIVSELSEYATDINPELSRRAIKAVGQLAVRLPSSIDSVMSQLLEFIDMGMDYVLDEAMVAIKNVLRKYPERAADIAPIASRCMKSASSIAGRCAVIWVFGEFGQIIPEAPYALEGIIDNIEREVRCAFLPFAIFTGLVQYPHLPVDPHATRVANPVHADCNPICSSASLLAIQNDTLIRRELLTATTKLFFKRPPEVQKMLGRLLQFLLECEDLDPDLSDRCMLYYRMLLHSAKKAQAVVVSNRDPVQTFTEDMIDETAQNIYRQFNTFSIIYDKPEEKFTEEDYLVHGLEEEEEDDEDEDMNNADLGGAATGEPVAGAQTQTVQANGVDSLLSFGQESDGDTTPQQQQQESSQNNLLSEFMGSGAAAAAVPSILNPSPAPFNQAQFQQCWVNPAASSAAVVQNVQAQVQDLSTIEDAMKQNNILTLASGINNGTLKAYMYAQGTSGCHYLCELLIAQNGQGRCTCKASNPADPGTAAFADVVNSTLAAPPAPPAPAVDNTVDSIMGLF